MQPRRLAGDTVFGAVTLLKWLVDRQITPHIPVWERSARPDGTFSRAERITEVVNSAVGMFLAAHEVKSV